MTASPVAPVTGTAEPVLLTAAEWERRFNIEILEATGWEHDYNMFGLLKKALDEPISRQEFKIRWRLSAYRHI